jgi:VRR-NUC domain
MDRPRKHVGKRFWKAYSALYGEATPRDDAIDIVQCKRLAAAEAARIRSTVPKCPTERQEQVAYVRWAQAKGIRLAASMNAGKRSRWEGEALRATGMAKGSPDLQIFVKRKGSGSLFLEMKRLRGSVITDEQREWVDWLNANGWTAHFAYGCEDAIRLTQIYLALPIA